MLSNQICYLTIQPLIQLSSLIAYDHIWLLAACVMYVMSGLGITAGAHRLWSHRSYKAKLPMRMILAIFNSMAFQVKNSLYFFGVVC